MPFGTLYTREQNGRSTAIKAVAKANNLDINIVEVKSAAEATPEHLKANGLGKIPAFVGEDGFALSEAIAIAVYFTSQNEKTTLLGKTKQDYASILKWLSFSNTEICSTVGEWYGRLTGRLPYNKRSVEDSQQAALKAVGVVDAHLATNTYLVGERITLADLFTAGLIQRGFQFFFDKKFREENPHVTRWFETIRNQEIYSSVAEKIELLETPALTNTPPKKPEQPKKEQPKKEQPKKESPKEEKPAEEAPKPKHPIEALPKPSAALDEWKRTYSNEKDHDTAMKWFFDNLKFEGEGEYSLWKVDYKYNDELTLVFMSNNLIGGFNNRLEGSRKYLFGCAAVYGENNASVIQGAFVIRGQDYLPVFDVAPDYESYTFTKLDPTKEEDRQFVSDTWGWEKPIVVDGKELPNADGKVFK